MSVDDAIEPGASPTPNESTDSAGGATVPPSLNKTDSPPQPPAPGQPSRLAGTGGTLGDTIFAFLAKGTGLIVFLIIGAIAVDLLVEALPSITKDKANFLFSSDWTADGASFDADNARFGVWEMFRTTVLSSVFALIIATPIAIGIATFLVEYAPRSISRILGAVVDLLAAVPSIIFGLWGLYLLAPQINPFAEWLNRNLGWFPLFATGSVSISGGGTIFTAGIVLAIMMLPIITSITREVLRQAPTGQKEAAQALGATKWEQIRMTSFPYARSGMIAASMLALGRALGETIAVMIILSSADGRLKWSLFEGGDTFASKIARNVGEFVGSDQSAGAYISAGLVLFILTFVVNAIARSVAGGKVNG